MRVRVTSIVDHGSIVQMITRSVATNRFRPIYWDHRMFSQFMESNPDLTLPFEADFDGEALTL